jgi:hypothetical protein
MKLLFTVYSTSLLDDFFSVVKKNYILDYKVYTQYDRIDMGVVLDFLCAKQKSDTMTVQ